MGSITVLKGQTAIITPERDFVDTGWEISGGYATHYPCNAGSIKNNKIVLVSGKTYEVDYTVDKYVSGTVYPILGGTPGTSVNNNEVVTDAVVCGTGTSLEFYSDGYLRLKFVKVTQIPDDVVSNAVTIGFNESGKKWVGDLSYDTPDAYVKFIDGFFAFKDGQLWQNNINETRNNFFGVQYPSKITFVININPQMVKNFYNQRQVASTPWASPNKGDIQIAPIIGKHNGQSSRLKKAKFNNYQGAWFADFLRDMNDPRFNTELEALLLGAPLQGRVLQITIENNDTVEARLVKIDVLMTPENYTF